MNIISKNCFKKFINIFIILVCIALIIISFEWFKLHIIESVIKLYVVLLVVTFFNKMHDNYFNNFDSSENNDILLMAQKSLLETWNSPLSPISVIKKICKLLIYTFRDVSNLFGILSALEISCFLLVAKARGNLFVAFHNYREDDFIDFSYTFYYLIIILLSYTFTIFSRIFNNTEILTLFSTPSQILKIWKVLLLFIAPIILSLIIGESFDPNYNPEELL